MSRPWSLNLVMMVGRVLLGAGMSLLEPCTLAPRESLRPSGTIQPGPPVCINATGQQQFVHQIIKMHGHVSFMHGEKKLVVWFQFIHTQEVSRSGTSVVGSHEKQPPRRIDHLHCFNLLVPHPEPVSFHVNPATTYILASSCSVLESKM